MCWHVSAPKKLPTPGKVPRRLGADTCRHVPAHVMPIIWTLFGCWYVLTCVSSWKSADTWEGADTSRCRHMPTPVVLIIRILLFANWGVLACVSTWKGADTWKGANTSRCRHMWCQSYELYLDADMCWHVSAPEKVPTPGKVPTHLGADTCGTYHMDFVICKLGCAGMCQHLKRCQHLGRCRHG